MSIEMRVLLSASLSAKVFPDDEVKQVFFDDNVPENSSRSRE